MKQIAPIAAVSLLVLGALDTARAATPTPLRALNRPDTWVGPADYPRESYAAGEAGVVEYMLNVGNDGIPKYCTILASSGFPKLDDMTCALLPGRARFEPGRDEANQPTGGTYQGKVIWHLPGQDMPLPIAPAEQVIEFDITDNGSIRNCSIKGSNRLGGINPCRNYRAGKWADTPIAWPAHVVMRQTITVAPLSK